MRFSLLFPLLLQTPAPHTSWSAGLVPLAMLVLGALLTWFWKAYDARQASASAQAKALSDLKQQQMLDILKIEGTLGTIITTLDRFAHTTENAAMITERVTGQGRQLDELQREVRALRESLTPQIAELRAELKHLHHD